MKKWFAWFLMAALLLALAVPATAEVASAVELKDSRWGDLNSVTKSVAYNKSGSKYYTLVDANGVELVSESAGYVTMSARSHTNLFKVEVKAPDGIHDEGFIDGRDGSVVVPAKYGDVIVISDRWTAGITLIESSAEDKDYTFTSWGSNGDDKFFRIDHTDFYLDGKFVGSLSRNEFKNGYADAHGAYLTLKDIEEKRVYYDMNLKPSPYQGDTTAEFDTKYEKGKTTYIHCASGQEAFVPSCTLNPDDLERPYVFKDCRLYDIQGNELFVAAKDYGGLYQYVNGYSSVRYDGKYGVLDMQGNEVVPVEYDEVGDAGCMGSFGYCWAVKDGKFGFLDKQGNVTCEFKYGSNAVRSKGTFGVIEALEGGYIVLTAGAGELPDHFAEVDFPSYDGSYAFVATNDAGEKAVIDLYGNYLLPWTGEYRSISLSVDGTVAMCQPVEGSLQLLTFKIDAEQAGQPAPEAEPAPDGEPAPEGEPAPAGDSWTCENGHEGNTGNFCSQCGAPKPEQPAASAFCTNCGASLDGLEAKFCPNCGQPLG